MEERLLQAVIDDPEDDALRLVFADYYEESGQGNRAEFIRLQVEEPTLPVGDPRRNILQSRAAQILRANEQAWLGPLRKALDRPRYKQLRQRWFRRGFLETIHLEARRPDFLPEARAELGKHPIQTVILSADEVPGIDAALAELAGVAELPGLRSLIVACQIQPAFEALRALGGAPGLGRLVRLALDARVSTSALQALEGTALAARLQSLKLTLSRNGGAELPDLLEHAAPFPALSSLDLTFWASGVPDLGRLARCDGLAGVRELALRNYIHGNMPVNGLLDSPLWGRLTQLSLCGSSLGQTGEPLAAAIANGSPRRLRLEACQFPTNFIGALVSQPSWGGLEELTLDGVDLSADGAAASLFRCSHLAGLTRLCLQGCRLGEEEVRELIASPHAARLRKLFLYEVGFPASAKRALKKRFGGAFQYGLMPS